MLLFTSAYPDYLQSNYHINYQIKILTSNQLQLHDILYHNSSLSYFIKVRKINLDIVIEKLFDLVC